MKGIRLGKPDEQTSPDAHRHAACRPGFAKAPEDDRDNWNYCEGRIIQFIDPFAPVEKNLPTARCGSEVQESEEQAANRVVGTFRLKG
jgi:hypothetical protein